MDEKEPVQQDDQEPQVRPIEIRQVAGDVRPIQIRLQRDLSANKQVQTADAEKTSGDDQERSSQAAVAVGAAREAATSRRRTAVAGTQTRTRRDTIFAAGLSKEPQATLRDRKKLGARIYRLKGYTTIGKVRRKRVQERRQRQLRNLLTFLLLVVLAIVLFVLYKPLPELSDIKKMLGMDSPFRTLPSVLESLP